MPKLLEVEFHCHTRFSPDSLLSPESLVGTCRRKGLDRVIVTDHNTIAGAAVARQFDPARVIVGEEILTTKGELLAAFVQEEIPKGLPPREAIARLREQGAFISVSHPFDLTRGGHWKLPDLLAILPLVDALETFNARCFPARFNRQAQEFASARGIPGTAGSDAHTAFELGTATLLLPPFTDAQSLRAALPRAEPRLGYTFPWVRLSSRWAVWVKQRSWTA